jgi:tetratricopeptide (TPR) repeat protein
VVPVNQAGAPSATNPPQSAAGPDAIQQAIEQLRHDNEASARLAVEAAAVTNTVGGPERTGALEERLDQVERTLRLQHESELEAVHSSNRTVLLVAIILAVIVLVGMVCAVLVLSRTMNRLSDVTTRLSDSLGWGQATALPALALPAPAAGELQPGIAPPVAATGPGLGGAIERLEKRIGEMEHAAEHRQAPAMRSHIPVRLPPAEAEKPFAQAIAAGEERAMNAPGYGQERGRSPGPGQAAEDKAAQVSLFVGKGQALLNLGQAEEALRCFDAAAAIDPQNAEVFVKRGMALEKLERMEEALTSYNCAIAADRSLTLAYLYKGAVCNRLQRFREALDCYDKALKTSG